MAETIKIGGELESAATGNVVAAASAIKDKVKNKYQGEINAETDAHLADRYTKAETYNKTELNNMITTPNQEYVSVTATSQTTSVTDVLPATGAADTTYRVGNWDGTQYNDSVFSEYAWNGSTYIKLSTKSQIGEVYDISANHADTKYADLTAALGVNGVNIPQSLRRGGMSVKYVQSSDNKYTQFRCKANTFTTDISQWAIDDGGVYTENLEFIRVCIDKNDNIICAIGKDGNFYFGCGVPQQIKDYIKNDVTQIYGEYIDNPEFLRVLTDNKGNILLAIKKNGDVYFGFGCPTQIKEVIGEYIDDPENRIEIKLDNDDNLISYRKKDGTLVENAGIETIKIKVKEIEADNLNTIDLTNVQDTLYVERPKFGEIWFEGELPTDTSEERTPTWLTMTFKNSGVAQFKCKCTLAIQGHGSIYYNKKGYTLEPYNASDKSISIKFGDMIAIDSFHLKAYTTDSLHCRDMANFNIWRDMVEKLNYPYSKFNVTDFALSTEFNKNKLDTADAKFAPDGFPVVCYLNGLFLGLYTIKLKKSRQNYAMEKSVKKQIFMDAISSAVNGMDNGFNAAGWDVKNPKMKNYDEGEEIPDATVLASINRLFDWLQQVDATDATTYQDYADYLNLPHWIVFFIFEELIFSEDIVNNNINLACWDANHWSIIPYDTDLSVGLHPWSDRPPYESYVILTEGTRYVLDYGIFVKFRTIFEEEIKSMWTTLRNSKFITPENIVKYYIEQSNSIPRDVYEADYKKWGNIWNNGIPCVEQLYVFINNRINWLDQRWLNQN